MLKVGITGGMGSGKSTVAKMFQLLDVPVYFADQEAKYLMAHHAGVRKKLIEAFGEKSFEKGELNRAFISSEVFGHPEKLFILNNIVHPAVGHDFEEWVSRQQGPFVLKEAALIFEAGSNIGLDLIIGVFCPMEQRLERVIKRDGLSKEQVLARMQNQMDEAEKMKLCDYVVRNDNLTAIIPQVLSLYHDLCQKALNFPN